MEGVRNPQLLAPSELTAGLAGEAATERGFHGDVHRPLGLSASQNTPRPGHGGPAAAPHSPPAGSPALAGKSQGPSQARDEGAQGSPCGIPSCQGSASSAPAMGWVTASQAPARARDLMPHHRAMLCAPAWGRGARRGDAVGPGGFHMPQGHQAAGLHSPAPPPVRGAITCPSPQPGQPAPAPGCAAEPELVLPSSMLESRCLSPCSQPSSWPWPAEELPCKEQVVPFTVSPRLLHSPFLHPTGKCGGGCGNVLALWSRGRRKCVRGVPRGRGIGGELPAWLGRPNGRQCYCSLPPSSG